MAVALKLQTKYWGTSQKWATSAFAVCGKSESTSLILSREKVAGTGLVAPPKWLTSCT